LSKIFKNISFYILIFILIAFLFTFFNTGSDTSVSFSEFSKYLKNDKITEMYIEPQLVRAKLADSINVDGKEYKEIVVAIDSVDVLYEHLGDVIKEKVSGDKLKLTMVPPQEMPFWLSILPTVIITVVFIAFWYFFMHQSQGGGGGGGRMMSFGKSRAKATVDPDKKKTFADVAGADEEKEELKEIVDFLKDPKKYTELGARIPKGVLLVGPPGTGKTLLAKAIAGEANVPFFSISGSDFVEMFVGVGASRVRDLFEQAKKNSPSIIFIDEIDAVGRQRGAGLGGGHDEREQTLNQLLVEMDGFGANEGVIIIAATNRPDILDRALLRPGRFDRQVLVDAPDVKGREDILKVHSKGKPLAEDVDLKTLAKGTAGFTGADLENLMNEAALRAAKANAKKITMFDIEESIMKVLAGAEKKTRVLTEKDRKITAYHEAGHAVAAKMLPTHDKVQQVSIIPRGRTGGYTMYLPNEEMLNHMTKNEMTERIVSLLGGRVAEQIVLGDVSTGASNDIERATQLATNMVMKYGMSDKLGTRCFGGSNDEVFIGRDFGHTKNYSEAVASEIDAEIKKIIDGCYDRCEKILTEYNDKLHEVASLLLEKEKIDAEEFEALFLKEEDTPEETVLTEQEENLGETQINE